MSAAGPLMALGLAMFFGGLWRAETGARLFETRGDWACAALGAATIAAALAMMHRGI